MLHATLGKGSPAARWLATIAELELPMAHHLVADIAIAERAGDGLVLEALTVASA